jgi:hypothetical protein
MQEAGNESQTLGLPSLPPRVRGHVQGSVRVSIGKILWTESRSFNAPGSSEVKLVWWGESGPGTLLEEGQEGSYILRCDESDMRGNIQYLINNFSLFSAAFNSLYG